MKDEKFEKLLGHPRVKKDAFKNKDGIDSEEAQIEKKKKEKKKSSDQNTDDKELNK